MYTIQTPSGTVKQNANISYNDHLKTFQQAHLKSIEIILLNYLSQKQDYFSQHFPSQIESQDGYFFLSKSQITLDLGLEVHQQDKFFAHLISLKLLNSYCESLLDGGRRKYFKVNYKALNDLLTMDFEKYSQKYDVQPPQKQPAEVPERTWLPVDELAELLKDKETLERQADLFRQEVEMLKQKNTSLERQLDEAKKTDSLSQESPERTEKAEMNIGISRNNNRHFDPITNNIIHTTLSDKLRNEEEGKEDVSLENVNVNVKEEEEEEKPIFKEKEEEEEETVSERISRLLKMLNQDLTQRKERTITEHNILYVIRKHGVNVKEILKAANEIMTSDFEVRTSVFAVLAANRRKLIFKDGKCVFAADREFAADPGKGSLTELEQPTDPKETAATRRQKAENRRDARMFKSIMQNPGIIDEQNKWAQKWVQQQARLN